MLLKKINKFYNSNNNKYILIIVSIVIIFIFVSWKQTEHFDECSHYKEWHSCERSVQDHCAWNKELDLCHEKCTAFTAKKCPQNFCHVVSRHCVEGPSHEDVF